MHRHRGNAAVLNWNRNALFDAMMQMIYPTVLRSRYVRVRTRADRAFAVQSVLRFGCAIVLGTGSRLVW